MLSGVYAGVIFSGFWLQPRKLEAEKKVAHDEVTSSLQKQVELGKNGERKNHLLLRE